MIFFCCLVLLTMALIQMAKMRLVFTNYPWSVYFNVTQAMRFLLVVLLLVAFGHCNSDENGLFAGDPNIRSLDNSNFFESIHEKDNSFVVIFYAHWCGHCINLSPIFKKFAQEISAWRSVVQVVVLDCGDPKNVDVCAKSNVVKYPTILLLKPQSNDIANAVEIKVSHSSHEHTVVRKLCEAVRDFLIQDHVHPLTRYITASFVHKKEEICGMLTHENKTKFIVVENKPSIESAELILDLLNYRNSISIKRFYGNSLLEESFSSIHVTLPAILEVNTATHPCTFKANMSSGQDMNAMKHLFETYIKQNYVAHEEPNMQVNVTDQKLVTKVTKYKLSYTDLYNTLRQSLLTEVMLKETFNTTQVLVIKRTFQVILKYFPFRNENVRRLFKRMNMWFANKGNKTMKSIQYREAMRISDGFLWPMESWRFCNGSKPFLRRYPCGLWVLFHTLTVNEYLNPPSGGVKHEVIHAMREYIINFFSCKECADHFAQATIDMENELIYPNSSVLFLWRIHNQVNNRLHGSISEDPFFPKVQFPPTELCDKCVEDDQYQPDQVLSFLTTFYSKKSISSGCMPMGISFSMLLLFLAACFLSLVR